MGESLRTGAVTPPGQDWTTGRTAASVAFVNEGEQQLFHVADLKQFAKLKEKIERVRSGEEDVTEYIEDWPAYIDQL